MKNIILKRVLKAVVAIVILCLVYLYLCVVFLPKDLTDRASDKYYRAISITKEEKNSLDIIMYGNSDLSSAIIPMNLYKETGITSFLNWGNQQSLDTIKNQIKTDLKRQKPEMIVLEVDCIYYENKVDTETAEYGNPLLAPFKYHTRWKELEFKDFIGDFSFEADDYKGYMYITKNGKYKYKNYMGNSKEIEPIQKSVVDDVKEIKKICDEENIKLLFIEAPSPSSWNMKRHNGVKDLATKLDIPFIDYNLNLEKFDFDYANNFRDKGNHCNYKGAIKITKYLADYLNENYNFADRRNDKNYKSWDDLAQKYEEMYS